MGLMDFLQRIPTINEMTGSFGEWLAKNYSKLTTDTLILHDVLIPGEDRHTSQIDMLMIGVRGIYVVEVKTYEGKVYGDGKKKDWYYYLHGRKYTIYSPIMQNRKHIKYLKEFLKDFGDVPLFSVVFMICDDFKVNNVNKDLNHIDTVLCSSFPTMSEGVALFSNYYPEIYTEAQKQEFYNYIETHQLIGKMHALSINKR